MRSPLILVVGLSAAAIVVLWAVRSSARRPADAAPPPRDEALEHDLARLREELGEVEAEIARLSRLPPAAR